MIQCSNDYESRPPFVIELAKRRIHSAAHLMGEIVERKQAEEALKESETTYRALFENSLDAIFLTIPDGRILAANKAACEMTGMTESEIIASGRDKVVDKNDPSLSDALNQRALKKNFRGELNLKQKDGTSFPAEISTGVYQDSRGNERTCVIARDITERKLAEKEQERLQVHLSQAQKMESVGRLAGGVAHDFNNKLSVINGYAELAMEMIDPSDPLHETIQEIHTAGKRSADIVRQLLAFARRQTISPVLLNLNDTISNMLKMLQRLIGENIDIAWHPGNNLWPVKIDPSQLDQLMANLAVNSRDAISDVGNLTIETKNVVLDEEYCKSYTYFIPGQYVMLAVSDDGCGMEKEVQDNLFEPFFTTKEIGKGTGLGLPTVYGIVKQNNGFINVYSEPGEGTIFKIYFPSEVTENAIFYSENESSREIPTGSETILMVEDEPAILKMGREMIERLGYTAVTAENPNDALRAALEYDGTIDLLITDVVMPEMNGRDLSSQLVKNHPGLKTLYMSGYTANVIAHHGVIDEGVQFIQKPFSLRDLADKVREVIEQG